MIRDSDHRVRPNAPLKQELIAELEELGHTVKNFKANDLIYANVEIETAEEGVGGDCERIVLPL